ncbi:hypothetical protein [Kutzneria kofuensis]|uniref:hypothetical protein n=1 Tax=Kutzneria kofuensis TaxID=103725 RepID=UPI0031F018E4
MLDVLRGRLSVVVAAAGYGKTTAVARWLRDTGENVLVVDDVHRDGPPDTAGDADRLVLISRRPIPVVTLLRYDLGAPVEIGPRRLALSPQQVAALLTSQYGVDDPGLAAELHRLTAGWPALVQLGGARLASEGTAEPLADLLAAPNTPLYDYVRGEVLDDLPPDALELLVHIAELGSISMELAAGIGQDRLAPHLALLARLGLLQPPVVSRDWYEPVPVVAAIVRAGHPMPPTRRKAVVALAAEWHTDHGRTADALRLALAAADHTRCAHLLREYGGQLLAAGAASSIVAAARALPERLRDDAVELVHADALQATGDTTGALAVYSRLAGDSRQLPPGLAWRYGAAVYLWGDPNDALAVLRRGRLDDGAQSDNALLLAWTSAAHWLAGDEARCAELAGRAYETRAPRATAAHSPPHTSHWRCAPTSPATRSGCARTTARRWSWPRRPATRCRCCGSA